VRKFLPIILAGLIFFSLAGSVQAAGLNLDPRTADKIKDEEFEAVLNLDTGGQEISGTDVIFNFNQDILEIKSVSFNNLFPLNDAQIDNNNGKLKLYSTMNSSGMTFKGNDRLVTMKLKGKKEGEGKLTYVCVAGETGNDTNIWKYGGGDIVDCAVLSEAVYQIKSGCQSPQVPANVKAESGPDPGQVTLSWDKADNAKYYNISYGPSSLNYQWGAPDVGDVDHFTVAGLNPGSPYYFIVTAVNDCGSSGALYEVAAYAGEAAGQPSQDQGYWQKPELVEYYEEIVISTASATPSAVITTTDLSSKEVEEVKKSFPFNLTGLIQSVLQLEWLKWLGFGLLLIIILASMGKKLVKEEKGFYKPEPEEKKEAKLESWPPPSLTNNQDKFSNPETAVASKDSQVVDNNSNNSLDSDHKYRQPVKIETPENAQVLTEAGSSVGQSANQPLTDEKLAFNNQEEDKDRINNL